MFARRTARIALRKTKSPFNQQALNLRNRTGKAYRLAKERYAALGVDTDKALKRWRAFPSPSIAGRAMTWAASRTPAQALGGGLAVTGNYPGKARTPDELRADFEKALSLIPGRHRFNLHACYAEMRRQEGGPRRARAPSSSRTGSPGRRQ